MNLFIGAHPDDIEINALGTILKLKETEKVAFWVMTSGEKRNGNRYHEQVQVAKRLGVGLLVWGWKDGYIQVNADTVGQVDERIGILNPKRVFVHCPNDLHQDHRAVSQIVTIANRHKDFDLYYYPPTDITQPFESNVLVDITEYYEEKTNVLKMFKSQQDRWYMDTEKPNPLTRKYERFKLQFMKGIK